LKGYYSLIVEPKTQQLPFYINTIGEAHRQEKIKRETYAAHHLLIVLDGKGSVTVNDNTFTVGKNDIFIMRRNTRQCYYEIEPEFIDLWITFSGTAADGLLDYYGVGDSFVKHFENAEKIVNEFRSVFQAVAGGVSEEKLSVRVYGFLNDVLSNEYIQEKKSEIEQSVIYMKERFAEQITLEDIAGKSNMTKFAFCRRFKERYSVTPFDYILQLRLQRAKELLITDGNARISDIALSCGFNDNSYFCRMFKRVEGLSPSEFRGK